MRRGSLKLRSSFAFDSVLCAMRSCQIRDDRVVNSLRDTGAPKQAIEGILIQKIEGSHHDIGWQVLAILPDADAFHSGRVRGFDTVFGVFHNDAVRGSHSQFAGRDEEHFRVRLTPMNIIS